MKFRIIYTCFLFSFLAVVFSSSSGGRAASANQGNTGAPGDNTNTCVNCHATTASIQVTLRIDVLDDAGNSIAASGYVPGTTYDAKVSINVDSGNPTGYGFQLLCLNAPKGQSGPQATLWSEPAANVKISTITNGRKYAEHKGISNSNEFMVKWTAPEAGAGTVTFYSCGNGVNRNGATSGDNAACNTLTLEENITSASTTIHKTQISFSIFPNPVVEQLRLQAQVEQSGEYHFRILDLAGKTVLLGKMNLPQGKSSQSIDLNTLNDGIYLLNLEGNSQVITRQFVKK